MGYWLGADALYVENLDFQTWADRHPEASPEGSLIRALPDGSFSLTLHGEVVKRFYTEYVPSIRGP